MIKFVTYDITQLMVQDVLFLLKLIITLKDPIPTFLVRGLDRRSMTRCHGMQNKEPLFDVWLPIIILLHPKTAMTRQCTPVYSRVDGPNGLGLVHALLYLRHMVHDHEQDLVCTQYFVHKTFNTLDKFQYCHGYQH